PPSFLGSPRVAAAPDGPALWPAAWRPTGPSRRAPRAPAGGAGGRGDRGSPGGLPALSAAVSGIHRPPARPGLATSGGGAASAVRAGDRVPDGRPALPGPWEADPRGPAAGRAPPPVRGAAHRRGGPAEWPVSVEPPGSTAVAAGPVGGPAVPGGGAAPGA